jgi:ATP-dependent Clp protease ATP-binding subunit ClpC
MAERGLQLELTDEAKDLLVEKGWDPAMGARPLRRAIQRYIEDPLADFVLRAELTPGATVMVEKAPEEDDREVSLTVVEPSKVPAAVGGGTAEAVTGTDDTPAEPGGALDQPTLEEPTDA